ncbi:amidohydrolase [Sphingomonas quercus]|uniref:Amidohydrolase n=1 Tax=Sphingomonas quercus TaxID=2842451 RepID=A0ABS6BN86_9SPHN|nr:amidohydrolase [Sphingomonas quercus]MBU3079317.1 amidohydrolase [Sphingomonas quercus]
MTRQHSRRGFIGLAGAGMAGLVGTPWLDAALAAEGGDADLVVFNAKVYTVDDHMARAQAFAVRNGRFVAVGSNELARALVGPRTQQIDAKQMTIVPGFIDCHNHATGEVLVYEVLVGNPFEVEFVTIQSIVDKLRKKAGETAPGTWVEGFFFDDTKVKDGRELNRYDLDKVSTQHPVVVRHRGGHTSYYNSRALELAGLTEATPNPPGGTFDKGPDGKLSGRVTDRARAVFEKVGTRPSYTPAQRAERSRNGLAHISKAFVRYGLTGVHHQGGDFFALQQVRANGDLLHRVSFETSGAMLDAMIANGIRTGFGDEWIKLGATSEHTVDGSFSERTMAMSTPYEGISPPYKGNVTEGQDVLNAWAEKVHRAGIRMNCHANGDVAIDMVLKAYERVLAMMPAPAARPKITHCTMINDDLLRRIKASGVVPAAFTTYAYYNSDKFHFYGAERMKNCMPFRSFLDAGIPVCAGSDFSPGPFAPLMGIQGMVTRTGWNGETWGANQRVTVAEALRINTLNGAYASQEEDIKGSITPGKLADFVMLADDIHTIAPDKIKDVKIVRTVTGGRTVYEA